MQQDPIPEAPEPPGDGECCQSSCGEACVWEKYYIAREQYAQALKAWRARHPEQAGAH